MLPWIVLIALVATALIPDLAAFRDAMAAEPRPPAWRVAGVIALRVAGAVLFLVLGLAGMLLALLAIDHAKTLRPGNHVRVTGGPWAGAEGVVAPDHNPERFGPVLVILRPEGVERREHLSRAELKKRWLPGRP